VRVGSDANAVFSRSFIWSFSSCLNACFVNCANCSRTPYVIRPLYTRDAKNRTNSSVGSCI
jgi:hypothetical protein